jgi:hypothetical protein
MRIWGLVCAGAMAALTFDLVRALATHQGVGPFEFAVGAALVALLVLGTTRFARHASRRV